MAIGCCLIEKAFSYLARPLRIRQHRHGSYVISVRAVVKKETAVMVSQHNMEDIRLCSAAGQRIGSEPRAINFHCRRQHQWRGSLALFGRIGKIREFNNLQAGRYSHVYTRASDVGHWLLPHRVASDTYTWLYGTCYLFPCKCAIGSDLGKLEIVSIVRASNGLLTHRFAIPPYLYHPRRRRSHRGDERVYAHVSVDPSAPTLLGLRRAKSLRPGGHLNIVCLLYVATVSYLRPLNTVGSAVNLVPPFSRSEPLATESAIIHALPLPLSPTRANLTRPAHITTTTTRCEPDLNLVAPGGGVFAHLRPGRGNDRSRGVKLKEADNGGEGTSHPSPAPSLPTLPCPAARPRRRLCLTSSGHASSGGGTTDHVITPLASTACGKNTCLGIILLLLWGCLFSCIACWSMSPFSDLRNAAFGEVSSPGPTTLATWLKCGYLERSGAAKYICEEGGRGFFFCGVNGCERGRESRWERNEVASGMIERGGGGGGEIPEKKKTRRPAAVSGMIPTSENPGATPARKRTRFDQGGSEQPNHYTTAAHSIIGIPQEKILCAYNCLPSALHLFTCTRCGLLWTNTDPHAKKKKNKHRISCSFFEDKTGALQMRQPVNEQLRTQNCAVQPTCREIRLSLVMTVCDELYAKLKLYSRRGPTDRRHTKCYRALYTLYSPVPSNDSLRRTVRKVEAVFETWTHRQAPH
ncbi:hypothetical protein PR048_025771 [Dryococelus australis]|uniref:Uncharacterized protein n=1 Tax=Dryococelus australis TaxID=614101 RepID=A0ABQ9GJI9_9NEOP|nr:hypothetical protein PR048_025771 [Dryococelus australis]